MRKLFVFLGVVTMTIGSALRAQEVDSTAPLQKSSWGDAVQCGISDYIPDIRLDARGGYNQDFTNKAGRFFGDGLYLNIDGRISPHFSYSFNHRIANSEGFDSPGFGNTNWLLLTYETEHFSVSAGKDAIFVGSFEYDAYDLDSYGNMNTMFWNSFSPWQWGVSAAWYPSESQTLALQCLNSPYSDYETGNLFAYALAWKGEWDFYESYWTANLWQYDKGKYVKALNFGNRFHIGDFQIDLEYMTRASQVGGLFKDDFAAIISPSYEWNWGRAFAKYGWEKVNVDVIGYDFTGTNMVYGLGIEFFPLKECKDIRFHAAWMSNTNYTGCSFLDIGLTWKLNLTEAGKRLFNKCQK